MVLQTLCISLFAAEVQLTVLDAEIEIPLEGVTISVSKVQETWFTDENGEVSLSIADKIFQENGDSLTLSAYLPGYATKKIRINSKTTELTINLSIEDVLEGKELVVEQQAYQKTDAESGISVVVTRDQFDNAAQIGSIPDVMTAVKTLPGVTYMGSFSQQPSIRGAYPYEMACIMDGTYVYSPFHWNGGVSIFDPMFIKSVKLSHGVFSARNGHAIAGLLDISTVEPEDETLKFSASVSDIITDGIFQVPITPKMGFVGGYRVSYYDTITWLSDNLGITKAIMESENPNDEEAANFRLSDMLTMPYMRDFYGKYYFNPSDRLHITLSEFLGIEGIGLHLADGPNYEERYNDTPNEYAYFDKYINSSENATDLTWKNIFSFGTLAVNILPLDNLQINIQGSYNRYNSVRLITNVDKSYYDFINCFNNWEYPSDLPKEDMTEEEIEATKIEYLTKYYHLSKAETSFVYEDSYDVNILQGKASADYSLGNNQILSAGFEEFYKTRNSNNQLNYHYDSYSISHTENYFEDGTIEAWDPEETKFDEDFQLPVYSVTGNRILNSIAYANYEFGDSNSKLQGEAGFRFEHYYIYNKLKGSKHRVNIGTIPTLNPRVSVRYKPEIKNDFLQDFTVSAGTGIFSNLSDSLIGLSKAYTIEGDKLKPDQDLFTVIGTHFDFLDNFSFQIEGYYKWYINRFYSIGEMSSKNIFYRLIDSIDNDTLDVDYINKAFCDGTGHVFGFDTMLQKKNGRYLDGYLTYSFIFAKYYNPFSPEKNKTATIKIKSDQEDPLGEWYYPYFHRFHTLSAVLNYRPRNGLVFTVTGAIVSGVPVDYDNPLNQLFTDTENPPKRTRISFPTNFRIGWSNYYKNSKIQYEWYFGVENILGFMNRNSLLGLLLYMNNHQDEDKNLLIYSDRIANFDTGIPILSLGLRISM